MVWISQMPFEFCVFVFWFFFLKMISIVGQKCISDEKIFYSFVDSQIDSMQEAADQ